MAGAACPSMEPSAGTSWLMGDSIWCGTGSLAAGLEVAVATVPCGGVLGGRIVVLSTSRCAISVSICDLNSFEARRSSASRRPAWRAIPGNFFGPKRMRARKKRKMVSEKLMASS